MIKVGIVGCGSIADVHAWALSNMEEVEITAMADVVPERAERLSERYTGGRAQVYASLEELLNCCRPDVLHICTPHYLHVPMAVTALRNQVAVFCEKPPAISMEQFHLLEQEVEAGKGRLGFCFQNRYNGPVRAAHEMLARKELGAIKGARAFVTWRRDREYYATDWKGKLETEGGGALINQSIHTLDLLLGFLGEPVEVKASVHNHHLEGEIQVEDTVEAWMRFPGGQRACFYASTGYASDAPVYLEITCEEGSITLLDSLVLVKDREGYRQLSYREPAGAFKDCWGNGHLTCIRDFYESMKKGCSFRNDLEGVKNTMQVMMEIYGYR